MDDARRKQVEALFQAAADVTPSERSAWLSQACPNAELRNEVARLLSHLGNDDDFLERPAYAEHGGGIEINFGAGGGRFGRYRLIRVIGQGGMGTVYEAEQDSPRRIVALKVIRAGSISPPLLKRFEREAQLLGQLQHPGIAQIYDAGAIPGAALGGPNSAAASVPYFAMELIHGLPLSEYVRQHKAALRERLELFARVCDAVGHAHQHGVLHRDLKPGNILVIPPETNDPAGLPQPKILDFGVARPLRSETNLMTLQTETGQFIGTLPYMSPEQVRGGAASTLDERSDIYSLGVILFELLSGRLPYDVRGSSLPEAVRMICEDEPSRLSSLGAGFGPLRFDRDLATIAAKTLEKDPRRRYATAGELAADLRRFLRDEPIRARPATALYQMRKFAKRHRALVGGVLATIVTLIIGLAGMTYLAMLERHQHQLADEKTVAARASEKAAQDEKQRAEQLAYRASVAAAQAALERHDVVSARRNLEAAPASLRGWEWRHFFSRLDASLAQFLLPYPPESRRPLFLDGGDALVMNHATARLPWTCIDWRSCRRLPDREGPVLFDAAVSGDSQYLVFTPESGPIVIRNLKTMAERTWDAQAWGIPRNDLAHGLNLSAHGERFFFYQHPSMSVWSVDVASGQAWRHAAESGGIGYQQLAMAADGRIAVTCMVAGAPAVWNPATDQVVALQGHRSSATAIAFTADGLRVITGAKDAALRLCDASTGECLAVGRGHSDDVGDIALSPDGRLIASAGWDGTLRFWSVDDLEPLGVLAGHDARLRTVSFTPDGQRVVTTADDETLRIWDAHGAGDPWVLRGHESYVYPVAVAPDGALIASGSWDNCVRLWDAETLQPQGVLRGHAAFVSQLTFSPSGRYLASTAADAVRIVWDVATGTEVARLQEPKNISYFRRLTFLNDDLVVLRLNCDRDAETWSWPTGVRADLPLSALSSALGEAGGVRAGLFADYEPQSDQLRLVATADGGERSALTVRWLGHVALDPLATRSLARVVAPSAADRLSVGVWNGWTGEELTRLRGHTGAVYAVAFSPDGRRIVTAGQDSSIRIWDAQDYTEITQLQAHTAYVWDLAFSANGEMLVSGSGDGTVRVWDTRPYRDHLPSNEPTMERRSGSGNAVRGRRGSAWRAVNKV